MIIDNETSFEYGKDVLFTRIEEEMVLLSLDSELYFTLNEVGTRIWELLGTNTFVSLIENLDQEYEDSDSMAVTEFVIALKSRNLITFK